VDKWRPRKAFRGLKTSVPFRWITLQSCRCFCGGGECATCNAKKPYSQVKSLNIEHKVKPLFFSKILAAASPGQRIIFIILSKPKNLLEKFAISCLLTTKSPKNNSFKNQIFFEIFLHIRAVWKFLCLKKSYKNYSGEKVVEKSVTKK
jgi:hypothetical protein